MTSYTRCGTGAIRQCLWGRVGVLSMHLAREGQAVAVVPDFVARQHDPTGVRVVPFASTAFGWKMSLIHCLGPPLAGTCQKLAQHLSGNRSRMGS